MLESLFNKVVELQDCNFIKNRPQNSCFRVKFTKFLKISILKNIWSDCFIPYLVSFQDFPWDVFPQGITFQLFHDRALYHIETSALICRTNQWTGFYMIGTSVTKLVK